MKWTNKMFFNLKDTNLKLYRSKLGKRNLLIYKNVKMIKKKNYNRGLYQTYLISTQIMHGCASDWSDWNKKKSSGAKNQINLNWLYIVSDDSYRNLLKVRSHENQFMYVKTKFVKINQNHQMSLILSCIHIVSHVFVFCV